MGMGGAELIIVMVVVLVLLAPTLVIGLIVWLAMSSKAKVASPLAPAAWLADPTARHELRYWDGAAWTTHVSDAGVQSVDGI